MPQAEIANAFTQLWVVFNSGDNAPIRNVTPARADLRRGLREACARVQRSCAVQWVAHAVKSSSAASPEVGAITLLRRALPVEGVLFVFRRLLASGVYCRLERACAAN